MNSRSHTPKAGAANNNNNNNNNSNSEGRILKNDADILDDDIDRGDEPEEDVDINDGDDDDSDDDFYKEVSDIEEDETLEEHLGDDGLADPLDVDFETTMKLVEQKKKEMEEREQLEQMRSHVASPKPKLVKKPEVMDDFIRNFLVKNKMEKTLGVFQDEWFDLKQRGELTDVGLVPDVYMQNRELEDEMLSLRAEFKGAKDIAKKAMSTWEKLKKERDYHKMHHMRVVQEKNKLHKDLERMKNHVSKYDPVIASLTKKYESSLKTTMLTKLEKDKLLAKVKAQEVQIRDLEDSRNKDGKLEANTGTDATLKKRRGGSRDTRIPLDDRPNPYASMRLPKVNPQGMSLQETFEGHTMSISALALHPKKPVVCTASDDTTWKMWSIPTGKLIMSGDGHSDWVSGCDFHPRGTHLATSSGDRTIKLWDFVEGECSATFTDHTQEVWSCVFHDTGDFLASASLDHTAKLWDLHSLRCRATFRGHVDSVNGVCFQPFTNNICTYSGDKTVSLWDIRTDLCIQTFTGHLNACSHAAFNLRGDTIASSDADGNVIIWDVRMISERMRLEAGPHPANKATFDPSGTFLAVASDDSTIKTFSLLNTNEPRIGELAGHKDAVQSVLFDPQGQFMLSAGSDATFRLWK